MPNMSLLTSFLGQVLLGSQAYHVISSLSCVSLQLTLLSICVAKVFVSHKLFYFKFVGFLLFLSLVLQGTIVRKLPRKVDVLEGENAAFCVEVEEEEMDIHWYKDGVELRETHQTILKSFGRTHILVFVNTTPQDSGLVTFYVGRSKTSSQLRVKGLLSVIFQYRVPLYHCQTEVPKH